MIRLRTRLPPSSMTLAGLLVIPIKSCRSSHADRVRSAELTEFSPMPMRLSASRFDNSNLIFRHFLGADYVAEIDGLRAGWILAGSSSGQEQSWWWTLTGPSCGPGRILNVGQCRSLDEARAELRVAFERWTAWAGSQAEPVLWCGSTSIPDHAPPPQDSNTVRDAKSRS